MQRSPVSALIIVLLVLPPGATPAETQTGHYNGGSVYAFGLGAGFVLLPDGRDLDRDNQTDVQPIGGVTLRTESGYRNVAVRIDDEIFADGAATNVCMYHPGGDLICNDDDHATGVGCGTRSLRDAPEPVRFVTVFVYSAAVTEDLDLCGASRGSVQATFT